MNRNVVHQSSPVQQMMAAGGPNWWNSNNMRPASSPPFPPQHSSPFLVHPPPGMILPQHISSWNDNQEFPDQSWSQLLMGGITNGEDKRGGLSHMQEQDKKLEIWEEQLLQQQASNGSNSSSIKQENSTNNYHLYASTTSHGYNINAEFQQTNSAAAKPSYSQLLNNIPPVISSPTISCVTSLSSNMLDFSNNKVDGKHPPPDRSSDQCNSTGAGGVAKKARVQPSSSTQSSTFKVRKEKLGDRITTLHQLVSPFGKTDTASVLLEALGYIRFLQSQIEALSLPYLGNGRSGSNMRQQQSETNIEEGKKDLRSKGLCLVPISCTIQVGSDNGADYWAPAAATFGGSF